VGQAVWRPLLGSTIMFATIEAARLMPMLATMAAWERLIVLAALGGTVGLTALVVLDWSRIRQLVKLARS
jgi:apolipoprotein N-acyltransferase